MTTGKWLAVKDLFGRCLNVPLNVRTELLSDQHIAEDVRAEVARLLANLENATTDFLEPPEALRKPTPFREPSLRSGDLLAGRFRIERFLGRGGMGQVYEALDVDLRERVALKMLTPELQDDPGATIRIRRELQVARRVTHPNVCRLFDLNRHEFPWGDAEFLSMEFLEGQTLADKVKTAGPLLPHAAFALLKQVAEGLAAAHRAGVIHRDLKPSNIMVLADSERTVVMDFGLARSFSPSELTITETGKLAGTLDYMAPELFTGGTASIASDVFALGRVALFTLTGSLVPTTDRLAPAWKQAIERALHSDPAQRFQSAPEFIEAVEQISATATLEAPTAARPALLAGWRLLRRHGLLTKAAAVGLALSGAGSWWLWERSPATLPEEAAQLYQNAIEQIGTGAYFAATNSMDRVVALAPRFALAHAHLAEAWAELQIPERATREMLLARSQDRLQIEAIDLTVTREFAGAVTKYELLRSKGGETFELDLGRAYEKAKHLPEALESYRRVTRTFSSSPAAWLRLAALTGITGDAVGSAAAFARAQELYQSQNNLEGLVELAFRRGVDASRHGDFARAKEQFTRSLDTARLAGNVQQQVGATLQLAAIAYSEGDTALAEQYASDGIRIAQSKQMEALAVVGVLNLGNALLGKHDFTAAERYYQDALAMARNGSLYKMQALTQLSLAGLYDQQKKDAEPEVRDALAYFKPNGYALETANATILLGRLQRDKGMLTEALASFTDAAHFAETAQDSRTTALANSSLGSLLETQERFPEALVAYRKNLELKAGLETSGYAALQTGSMLWRLGQFDEASRMFDRAEEASQKFPALRLKIGQERARMDLSQDRPEDAARIARKVLLTAQNNSASETARYEGVLGLALLSMGKTREASRLCEKSISEIRTLGDVHWLIEAQLSSLAVQVTKHNINAAKALFDEMGPLNQYPETQWRALALLSQVDPQYRVSSRTAYEGLHRLWGETAWSGYMRRPDVTKLSESLFAANSR
jgi:tetratricopeptide (TPR) repeat protein